MTTVQSRNISRQGRKKRREGAAIRSIKYSLRSFATMTEWLVSIFNTSVIGYTYQHQTPINNTRLFPLLTSTPKHYTPAPTSLTSLLSPKAPKSSTHIPLHPISHKSLPQHFPKLPLITYLHELPFHIASAYSPEDVTGVDSAVSIEAEDDEEADWVEELNVRGVEMGWGRPEGLLLLVQEEENVRPFVSGDKLIIDN